MTPKKYHQGFTLIEIILVLVIAASILILGIRQYEKLEQDLQINQVKADVDQLFIAMTNYYYANCKNPSFYNGGASVPVTINDLISQGFLKDWQAHKGNIVSQSGNDYVLQFNRSQVPKTMATDNGQKTIGQIIRHQIQISVFLNPKFTTTNGFTTALEGQCMSDVSSATCSNAVCVAPCSDPNSISKAVVFMRYPSMVAASRQSDAGLSSPSLDQDQQLYSSYPLDYLTSGFQSSAQYYLCNS